MANKIVAANKYLGNNGKMGGIFRGDRHSAPSGGIEVQVEGSSQKILVEDSEPIIVPKAVNANTKVSFDGKKMTPKQVISKINTDYGGVPIKKKGGFVDVKAEIKRLKDIKERGGNIEQPIKVKAGSVVVTRGAILNDEKHEYNGEMLTNKEILSKINHDIGGGVEFAEGGKIENDNYEFEKNRLSAEYEKVKHIDTVISEYGTKEENGKQYAKVDKTAPRLNIMADYLVLELEKNGYEILSDKRSGGSYYIEANSNKGYQTQSFRVSDHIGRGGIYKPDADFRTFYDIDTYFNKEYKIIGYDEKITNFRGNEDQVNPNAEILEKTFVKKGKNGKDVFDFKLKFINPKKELQYIKESGGSLDCGCNHTMQNGGLIDAIELSKNNLQKNGLVLKSHDKSIIVLAYNTGVKEFNPSLYNLRLIRDVVAKIDNLKSNELVSIFVNQVSLERFDEKKLDEYKKAKHLIICNQNEVVYNSNDNFESGGLIPQQGTLYTKDKTSKLEYQKKGNDYVFKVYDVDYTRNQYKKRGDNEAIMNYKQFINYLYAELYIDDKLEQGGEIGNPNENFIKWFVEWFKDGVSEVMNITISIPILDYDFGIKAKKNEILILDLFEKIDQNIDAKPYLKTICEKANYYGVYFLCEPMLRYKYLLTNIEKRKKISVEYLINYYKSFGFKNIEGKKFMVREPKNKFEKGGEINHEETYKKWKSLVNMSKSELENFYNSEEGKKAGLSSSKANQLGIHSGRESARWIMKMKDTPHQEWTPTMWDWANRQISFISRMSGNKGGLYDDKGNKTRKHTSLLIWGHNPKKFESGGNLIKRADGHYSKHGLWDSIRENAGSGRKPTKEMLEQEEKIKNNSMEKGGEILTDHNAEFKKLKMQIQEQSKLESGGFVNDGEVLEFDLNEIEEQTDKEIFEQQFGKNNLI